MLTDSRWRKSHNSPRITRLLPYKKIEESQWSFTGWFHILNRATKAVTSRRLNSLRKFRGSHSTRTALCSETFTEREEEIRLPGTARLEVNDELMYLRMKMRNVRSWLSMGMRQEMLRL